MQHTYNTFYHLYSKDVDRKNKGKDKKWCMLVVWPNGARRMTKTHLCPESWQKQQLGMMKWMNNSYGVILKKDNCSQTAKVLNWLVMSKGCTKTQLLWQNLFYRCQHSIIFSTFVLLLCFYFASNSCPNLSKRSLLTLMITDSK